MSAIVEWIKRWLSGSEAQPVARQLRRERAHPDPRFVARVRGDVFERWRAAASPPHWRSIAIASILVGIALLLVGLAMAAS